MKFTASEQRILEAALNVVNQYTISGTRMHLIAEEAGMSPANLHYHFKTKKDLMMALLHHLQDQFVELRTEEIEKQPADLRSKLSGFFKQKKNLILYNPKLDRVQFDFWTQGQIDPEINLCFLETFRVWREHIISVVLQYRPNQDVEKLKIASEMMVSMMMGATMQYLNSNEAYHIDHYFEMCEQAVLEVLNGD